MSQIGALSTSVSVPDIKKLIPDVGGDVPPNPAGLINIVGGPGIITTGTTLTNTLTIETSDDIADSFLTDDDGIAVPASGQIIVKGGWSIGTSSAGSTIHIDIVGTEKHAVQIGAATGDIISIAVGEDSQVLKGNTGAEPSWGAVDVTTDVTGILPVDSGGTGADTYIAYTPICGGTIATGALQSVAAVGSAGDILTSNGAAALPTFQAPGGITWSAATANTNMVALNGYITLHATPATKLEYTLPASCDVGKVLRIAGQSVGGWKVIQGAGQYIHFSDVTTTVGAAGYLQFTDAGDCVEIVCIVADLGYRVISSIGNIAIF